MVSDLNPLIRKMQHLAPLTPEEEGVLANACSRIIQVGKGEDIVVEGDKPHDSNILLEGIVSRYKLMPDGKRQIMAFQFPGDMFDAQSFLLPQMDHSIGALAPCRIAVLPHQVILEIIDRYPRIARAIWKDTLIDASVFREWVVNVGRRQAKARLAHLMCEVFTRMSIVGLTQGDSVAWPMTQSVIGDALGLSNVHVNRSLQELRGSGLITLEKGRLTIDDWSGLQEAGEFDPTYLHLRMEPTGRAARSH